MIDQRNQLKQVFQHKIYSKTAAKVKKKVTTFGKNIHLEKFQPYGDWFSIFLSKIDIGGMLFYILKQYSHRGMIFYILKENLISSRSYLNSYYWNFARFVGRSNMNCFAGDLKANNRKNTFVTRALYLIACSAAFLHSTLN